MMLNYPTMQQYARVPTKENPIIPPPHPDDDDDGTSVYNNAEDFVEATIRRGRVKTDTRMSIMFTCCLMLFISMLAKQAVNHSTTVGSLGRAKNFSGLSCGFDEPVASLPFLYVPIDPADGKALKLMKHRSLCVARCPDETDVGAKAYLDVPDAAFVQDKSKSTILSLVHSVKSPVYVTKPFAGTLCYPDHPALLAQAEEVFEAQLALSGLRLVAGGLWMAAPLAVGAVLLATGVTWLTSLMLKGSGNVLVACWLALGALAAGLHGVKLLLAAASGFDHTAPWSYLLMGQQRNLVLVGCIMIIVSFTLVGWMLSNWRLLGQSLQLAEAVRQIMPAIPTASGLYLFLQLTASFTAFLSVFGFLMIQSTLNPTQLPTQLSLNPNGGVEVLPIEKDMTASWSSVGSTMMVWGTSVWMLEVLLTLCKYAVVFTGGVWYFSPIDSHNHRHSSANLPLFGLVLGLNQHLGSVALYSGFRWLSRPFRVLFLGQSLDKKEEDLRLPEEEREPSVKGEGLAQRFCEIIHSGVIYETVSSSRDVWAAFRVSQRRMTRALRMTNSMQHMAAATIGLPSLITWSVAGGVMIVTFTISNSILMELTSPSHPLPSALFFSTPIFSSLLIALIAGYVSSIPLVGYSALMDSLLYCVVEERCPHEQGDMSLLVTGPSNGKTQCPESLVDFFDALIANRENSRMSTTVSEE
eukprot:Blabericola_migrator_1__3406@NODE_1_length_33786_cov_123_788665_g0_i0_p4_GENE_NODE_1_length_33786_cov_123_788665_g0_i0NODE_1_length_33786_cov_123_788665_g0_i0_p4_ORF_typecomplete_len694_score79_76_NODE_1_length_33786_cov_123_788665_g0_i0932711408